MSTRDERDSLDSEEIDRVHCCSPLLLYDCSHRFPSAPPMPYTVDCNDEPPRVISEFTIDIPFADIQQKSGDYPLHQPAKFIHVRSDK